MRIFLFVGVLFLIGCGGGSGVGFDPPGDGEPQLTIGCAGASGVISETDEQAFLQIGGAFDQLRHDEDADDPIKMTTKIDNFVRTYMCQNDIPGLGLGIVWQGNLVYVKGYGLARGWETASTADDEPVRGQRTRFRWASVSKCITGLAAVIASQETNGNGEPYFDLDANLQFNYRCGTEICAYVLPDTYYLDWFEEDDDNEIEWPLDVLDIPGVEELYDFTPRRLLAMRCGVMHYNEGDPDLPSGSPSQQEREDNVGFIWAIDHWTDQPLVHLPGGTSNYSSFSHNMAGAALDWAVPGTYWSYVQSRIADMAQPSPMVYLHPDDTNDPQYDGAPWLTTADRAHGYSQDEDTLEIFVNETPDDVSYKLPSGGFISTTADMALFANGLLNNHFLNQAGMDALFTPQENIILGNPGTPDSGYALGFSTGQQSGERIIAHNGGQQDAASRLVLFPDGEDPSVGKLGIVIMSNARYLNRNAVANGVEALLRNPYVPPVGGIVFNGTTPQNPDFAAQDLGNRNASGPYVDNGEYLDASLDVYETNSDFRVPRHTYHPDFLWLPTQIHAAKFEKDDVRFETPEEKARRILVIPPSQRETSAR